MFEAIKEAEPVLDWNINFGNLYTTQAFMRLYGLDRTAVRKNIDKLIELMLQGRIPLGSRCDFFAAMTKLQLVIDQEKSLIFNFDGFPPRKRANQYAPSNVDYSVMP